MQADFIVGGVARDEDFIFHKDFVEDLKDSLGQDHVLLIAPRRTGKTSVMFNFLDHPPEGRLVIHLNVEELGSPAEFFVSLIDAINEHQPDFFRRHLAEAWDVIRNVGDKVEEMTLLDFKIKLKKSADWEKDWDELAGQLNERLVRSLQPILFIIDELPDMLITMQEREADLKSFLHRFRTMRLAPRNTHIRWLVGGSVNIRGTLEDAGLINLINDFRVEVLPPISAENISAFVQQMFDQKGVPYSPEVIPRMQSLLGTPIALFLQLLTQELYRYWRRHQPAILTAEHVERVFNQSLLGEAAHDKLQHYYTRIRLHYPEPEREAAYGLLNVLSRTGDGGIEEQTLFQQYVLLEDKKSSPRSGEIVKQAFKNLLVKLQSDFYIHSSTNGRLNFGNRLLKLWWRKTRAYGYE